MTAWWEYAIPGWNAYKISQDLTATPAGAKQAYGNMNDQAQRSGGFADALQQGYALNSGQLNNTYGRLGQGMDYLRGQMMGQNSVSAEQLRQGLQQNQAAQMSAAASASPLNQAMAARTAAMQMGRLGSAMSGQQALAGIQERNAAASQYGQLGSALGQLQLGARGQDIQGANGARQNALSGYGAGLNNPQNQTLLQRYQPLFQAAGGAAAAL